MLPDATYAEHNLPLPLRQCRMIESWLRGYPRCSASGRYGGLVVVPPMPDARPNKLPPPPTPLQQLDRRGARD